MTRAVVLGVPLPLCSCGVIPAAITLKKDGGSDGAAVGFLISTPQTGVDSILVTASMLGWPFAIFKVFAALITGVIGGFCVERLKPDTPDGAQPAVDFHDHQSDSRGWREALRYGHDELLYPIWRWLLVGMLVSAAMTTVVPHGQFATLIEGGIWTLLLMVAISVPRSRHRWSRRDFQKGRRWYFLWLVQPPMWRPSGQRIACSERAS